MVHFDWNVYTYDYQNRIKNLNVQAQSRVKSDKFFPVFLEDGKEKVFKPLSKTKPFSTPFFAYSEVFWSSIINKYFDPRTPVYRLAICNNIEEDLKSKYPFGTIVDSINIPEMEIASLYEVFRDNPDSMVNINEYFNVCEYFYDYSSIFESKLMIENEQLAKSFAMQVLLSILKIDQNYHYENPLFYKHNGKIIEIAPMIDHEFSTMFLYLDNPFLNKDRFNRGLISLTTDSGVLSKNLDVIISKYQDTTMKFLEKLKFFHEDIKNSHLLLENYNYIMPFNSSNFMIGYERYKNKNEEEAKRIEQRTKQYNPDIKDVSDIIYYETLLSSRILEKEIEKRLLKRK